MKTSFRLISFLLFFCSVAVLAADRRQSIGVDFGVGFPLSKLDLTSQQGGKDDIGKMGYSWGVRYLYNVIPALGLGAEVNGTPFGESSSDVLIPGGHTTIKDNTHVFLAIAKYIIIPTGPAQPYLIGGLGFHSTSLDGKIAPPPGFLWIDTGTREARSLVDDTQQGFAAAVGAGVDVPVNDIFFVGFEGRYQHLAEVTYNTSARTVQTFGVSTIKAASDMFNLMVKFGIKF